MTSSRDAPRAGITLEHSQVKPSPLALDLIPLTLWCGSLCSSAVCLQRKMVAWGHLTLPNDRSGTFQGDPRFINI